MLCLLALASTLTGCATPDADNVGPERPPNFVIIFVDDVGYGDLGSYGHPTIRTPNLDRMAAEGQRWTSFYAQASVCSPSRAALLTGRLHLRSGMYGANRVLFPDSQSGLPDSEIVIAEALREIGYATAIIGKWHLGHLPRYLPTNHGFDYWFGLPYSNDMDSTVAPGGGAGRAALFDPKIEYYNVPLYRNDEEIERPADQNTLTRRYTEEATRFIRDHRDEPFFLYIPHSMAHVPLFASDEFRGTSPAGIYGDVIEEIDGSVGRVLDTLREEGLAENTLVVFTSDNGPWLAFETHGGSAGPFRHGKGTTFEGGMRVPGIFWWPGTIAPEVRQDMGSAMDLFTTVLTLAGAEVPQDRVIDGLDLSPALLGTGPGPRNLMFYYRVDKLYAIRKGPYKAHFITQGAYGQGPERTQHDPPLLFHLGEDPGERFDIAAQHPEVVEDLLREAEAHRRRLEPGPPLFDLRGGG